MRSSRVARTPSDQQNVVGADVAVIVMHASSNDIAVLQPLMKKVLHAIPGAKRGVVTNIRS